MNDPLCEKRRWLSRKERKNNLHVWETIWAACLSSKQAELFVIHPSRPHNDPIHPPLALYKRDKYQDARLKDTMWIPTMRSKWIGIS